MKKVALLFAFSLLWSSWGLFSPKHVIAVENGLNNSIIFASNISGRWNLWDIQPDGKGLRQITKTDEDELSPCVSPDGKQIVYADGKRRLHIIDSDGTNGKIIPLPPGIFAHPSWRPDGKALIFVKYTVLPSDQGELWRIKRHAGVWQEPERITAYPPMRIYPSYSPDGKLLTYAEFRRDKILGVIEEIGIADLEKKQYRLITNKQADSYHPVWSPLGDKIAYVSNAAGNYDIWIINIADGTCHPVTHDPSFDGDPAWSPDGKKIAFVSNRTGNREIWVISLLSDQLRQITTTRKTCSNPFWVK